jgi:hypothetical protein
LIFSFSNRRTNARTLLDFGPPSGPVRDVAKTCLEFTGPSLRPRRDFTKPPPRPHQDITGPPPRSHQGLSGHVHACVFTAGPNGVRVVSHGTIAGISELKFLIRLIYIYIWYPFHNLWNCMTFYDSNIINVMVIYIYI